MSSNTTVLMASLLPVRTDLHLARKVWHMGMGLFAAGVFQTGISRETAVAILGSVFVVFYILEQFRLRVPELNAFTIRIAKPLMRSSEVNRVSGLPYYALGLAVAIALFPRPIGLLAILYLACGDPIASLIGIRYGDRSIRFANGKSLIGTAAGMLVCAAVTFVFLLQFPISLPTLLALTTIGGIAGGGAELLPVEMDDNFTIPVVSGFIMWLAFILFSV